MAKLRRTHAKKETVLSHPAKEEVHLSYLQFRGEEHLLGNVGEALAIMSGQRYIVEPDESPGTIRKPFHGEAAKTVRRGKAAIFLDDVLRHGYLYLKIHLRPEVTEAKALSVLKEWLGGLDPENEKQVSRLDLMNFFNRREDIFSVNEGSPFSCIGYGRGDR